MSPATCHSPPLPPPPNTDGSNVCGSAVNTPAIFSNPYSPVVGAPPAKFIAAGYLPANWWVFGQPLLQQMYPVSGAHASEFGRVL